MKTTIARIAAVMSLALVTIGMPSRADAVAECYGNICYYQVCNTAWVNVCYLCQCPGRPDGSCYCLAMTGALAAQGPSPDGISPATAEQSKQYSAVKAKVRAETMTPEATKAAQVVDDSLKAKKKK